MPLVVTAFAFAASPALASADHSFDPTLSLRGSCTTTSEDQVLDPGCPYPEPQNGGPRPFENPCGLVTDSRGDIYVANSRPSGGQEGEGWIDIFNAQGEYLTRIDENAKLFPCGLAVDSEGNLYVTLRNERRVVRYTPSAYPPQKETTYEPPSTVFSSCIVSSCNVAVDPSNGHLYIAVGSHIAEFDSAANGNAPVAGAENIGAGLGSAMEEVDVCGKSHDVYVAGQTTVTEKPRVFVFDGVDGHKIGEIDYEGFGFHGGQAGLAVDQMGCDVYVDDVDAHGVVDQFHLTSSGGELGWELVGQLPQPPHLNKPFPWAALAVDDPIEAGEAGYDSPNEGYVYVTSGQTAQLSALYAFAPRIEGPPRLQGQVAGNIGETEAVLEAELNPGGRSTGYHFEYTTEAAFEVEGYDGAGIAPVPDGDAGEGAAFQTVSAAVTGLLPGVGYRFRLVADNCPPEGPAGECLTQGEGNPGGEGEDSSFATYPIAPSSTCSNAVFRAGPSSLLPDCRAYELVTPADTNGRAPTLAEFGRTVYGAAVETTAASADGESLVFGVEGGTLPGLPGGGFHDGYTAHRGSDGWQTEFSGLAGAQSSEPIPGGFAEDPEYSFWEAGGNGSLVIPSEGAGGIGAHYVHRPGGVLDPECSPEPGGDFEWIGCGSLGQEPRAFGKWIGSDGARVIFATEPGAQASQLQLESCAAPTGTTAIYDRTADGTTHCVSVKPDGTPFSAGEDALYKGASADGAAVAFAVGGTLFENLNAETVEVATGGTAFAGLAQKGGLIFYLRPNPTEPVVPGTHIEQGDIFACDTGNGPCAGAGATQQPTQIGSGEESVVVNVSADGSHVYFVSPRQLGGEGEAGASNLYVWDGSSVRLIGVLEDSDVSGEPAFPGSENRAGGLGLWLTDALSPAPESYTGPAADPSRLTPNGQVLVFESRAKLTTYDNAGHREVYRYDAGSPSGGLTCMSCNPTRSAAVSDARLESSAGARFAPFPPVNALTRIANVSSDGRRVFFQSADRLVARDVDEKIDVYEWEAQSTAGCERAAGCLALISSGNSAGNNYLYAMSPDGHDVFFQSGDLLTSQDNDGTPSIYDARVEGGFPATQGGAGCQGDACQGGPTPAPVLSHSGDASPVPTSPSTAHRCPKGKQKMRKGGKVRCVSTHRKKGSGRHGGKQAHNRGTGR
jgi:hypothetical protein